MPSDAEGASRRARLASPVVQSGLEVAYRTDGALRTVLHGASFTIEPGQRVAIVGESGSGKSTTAAAVLGLLPGSGRVTGGRIEFKGEDITRPSATRLASLRGREIGLVPQDPMSNLNPVLKVGRQIAETLAAHGLATGEQARTRAVELMGEAGIPDAARRAQAVPARVLRRHAAARADRHRAGLPAPAADRRRAHLRARRHRAAADPRPPRGAARRPRHLADAHHPRPRAGGRPRRPGGRHVEGPDRRGRAGRRRSSRRPQAEYTRTLVAAAPSVGAARLQASGVRRRLLRRGDRGRRGRLPRATARARRPRTPTTSCWTSSTSPSTSGCAASAASRSSPSTTSASPSGAARTTAVVGESGSGKTTTAQMVLGLETPTSGEVRVRGEVVETARGAQRRAIRRAMQPVFQDPYASLNPTFSIERIIDEPLRGLPRRRPAARRRRVARAARPGGPAADPGPAPAQRAVRRAAAAGRHRPRAGARPRRRGLRRGRLGARRAGAGPDARPCSTTCRTGWA